MQYAGGSIHEEGCNDHYLVGTLGLILVLMKDLYNKKETVKQIRISAVSVATALPGLPNNQFDLPFSSSY